MLHPHLPDSGTLVLVSGPQTMEAKRFSSVDDLRMWEPEPGFTVRQVQIFCNRPPVQSGFTERPGRTTVKDLEGMLAIRSATVESALAAYEWAYGTASTI